MKHHVICGIDPSLRGTGCALIRRTKFTNVTSLEMVDCAVRVTRPPQSKGVHRVKEEVENVRMIFEWLDVFLRQATHVIVELPTNSQSNKGAVSNGVCYSIAAVAKQKGLPITFVLPSALKQWSGSKRGDGKERVAELVKQRTGVSGNDNVIDAIGLCLIFCDQLSRQELGLPTFIQT